MSEKKWCHQGITPFRDKPNGKKLMDLGKGAVVNVLGEMQSVPVIGVDKKSYDTRWYKVDYKDSKGIHTGWVRDVYLDDYVENSPNFEVRVPTTAENPNGPHATENESDPAQNVVIDGNIKRNLCGELCVAFVMRKGIDEFLNDWKNFPTSQYTWALGGKSDKTTVAANLENMLAAYDFTIANKKLTTFTQSLNDLVLNTKSITSGVLMKILRSMLPTHSLIANVYIDLYGKLIPASTFWRKIAHWVVVDKFTPNGRGGGRVELYNPYINKRQEYSLDEFKKSFGGGTFTGLWVKRDIAGPITLNQTAFKKWCVASAEIKDDPGGVKIFDADEGIVVEPTPTPQRLDNQGMKWSEVKFRGRTAWIRETALDDLIDRFPDGDVKIPNATPDENDAAQYMFLEEESGVKNNMCGQLCASFIIGVDIESFVKDWKNKATQYYKLAIAGAADKPTGLDSLQSMFRVAPYEAQPADIMSFNAGLKDPIIGRTIVSPGRIKEKLLDYHLVAGVFMRRDDHYTGKLSGQGIGHWVVLESITPNGRAGGNGGWVEIYNPFPNKRQEYSYDEFMASFRTLDGLWVKRKTQS
ncbi:MAG: hypothetical protein MUO77_00480 [Anaerolineales bacterium]|nr:hypothetical protein [Anaerolineales bacterium]